MEATRPPFARESWKIAQSGLSRAIFVERCISRTEWLPKVLVVPLRRRPFPAPRKLPSSVLSSPRPSSSSSFCTISHPPNTSGDTTAGSVTLLPLVCTTRATPRSPRTLRLILIAPSLPHHHLRISEPWWAFPTGTHLPLPPSLPSLVRPSSLIAPRPIPLTFPCRFLSRRRPRNSHRMVVRTTTERSQAEAGTWAGSHR